MYEKGSERESGSKKENEKEERQSKKEIVAISIEVIDNNKINKILRM